MRADNLGFTKKDAKHALTQAESRLNGGESNSRGLLERLGWLTTDDEDSMFDWHPHYGAMDDNQVALAYCFIAALGNDP